jgi:hypothetical protein
MRALASKEASTEAGALNCFAGRPFGDSHCAAALLDSGHASRCPSRFYSASAPHLSNRRPRATAGFMRSTWLPSSVGGLRPFSFVCSRIGYPYSTPDAGNRDETHALKGEPMSDVEKEMDELERKLAAKTREIEALVAAEQNLGDPNAMESTDYARLQSYVEELIYKWQEAKVHSSGCKPGTAVDRLIAEREEIEEQILTLQVR